MIPKELVHKLDQLLGTFRHLLQQSVLHQTGQSADIEFGQQGEFLTTGMVL